MKAIVVQKQFNSYEIGTIISVSEEAPKGHYANDGFLVAVEIPEGLNTRFLKAEYTSFAQFWSKSGEANLTQQPVIEENQPITQNGDSWTFHPFQIERRARWTKPGYADQFDPPPMVIVNGQEQEDDSWTYEPSQPATPERWVKGNQTVYQQPTIQVDNFVDVPDTSWTYHPARTEWVIVEDTVAVEAFERARGVQRYIDRIQYADTLIAEIGYRNESKQLTEAQTIAQATTYAPIMQLLKSGSYRSARGIIAANTPAAHITQQDITYMLSLIDAYLAKEAEVYG